MHFEAPIHASVSYIRADAGALKDLHIEDTYFALGSTTDSFITGTAAIDLAQIETVTIDSSFGFRPFKPFLKIDAVASGHSAGKVKMRIVHDAPENIEVDPEHPLYLFTGIVPQLDGVTYTVASDA